MSEEVQKSVRVRINVSTTAKGIKTWDATVELSGPAMWTPEKALMWEAYRRSKELVEMLDREYPAKVAE